MLSALGDVLPQAIIIALSPVPVMALILMLVNTGGRPKGVAFAAGAISSLLVIGLLTAIISDGTGLGDGDDGQGMALVKLLLGLGFFALAAKQWRNRPLPDRPSAQPGWIKALDKAGPLQAFGFGALVMGVNPKNLSLVISGVISIAAHDLPAGQQLVALIVFACIAGISVMLPVLAVLLMGERGARALDGVKEFLAANTAVIMMVLFIAIGAKMVGSGIASLG